MKILVICQYYYPEPFRITDICEELVKKGNDVTVITGIPNYPMGEIYEGYKDKSKKNEVINGVKVHRCFTIPRKHGPIFRFLNYYSYAISSSLYVKKLKEAYDVVFVNQLSPVMMANAGINYKKKHNTKLVLYCLDLWPESLLVGGIKKGSLIYKYFEKVSKRIYTKADKILVTSKSFIKYLKNNFSIDGQKITYLPQYAETIFSPEECAKKENENIDLLFAGNLGKAQSIDTIIKAANEMKDIKNLYWHIVGDGSEYELLMELAKKLKLKNVIFYGRKPLEEMPKYYRKADAMLVTLQADSIVSETLPGKVQTYMAAGKPIIGAINGEAVGVIKDAKCGYCGPAEDYKELVKNVNDFINYSYKKQLGENAYKYYEKKYKKKIFLDALIKLLYNNF